MLAGEITVKLNFWVTRNYFGELLYGNLVKSAVSFKGKGFGAEREFKNNIRMLFFQFQQ